MQFSHAVRTLTRTTTALALGAMLVTALAPPVAAEGAKPITVRIGYQKIGDLLLLKGQGALEKRFARDGITVQWVQFQSGPPLLEALNAGSIDFGYTGDAPPIFAQAAGTNLVYVAYTPDRGRGEGILVHKDAGITTLADLRGKKVAFTRGSSANNAAVKFIEKGGLRYDQVNTLYLQPADAAAAFQNGSIDAWVIWDPFFALYQRLPNAKVLATDEGVAPSNAFYLSRRDFATRYPEVVSAVIAELDAVSHWGHAHPQEVAHILAQASGVDESVELVATERKDYGVAPLTPDVVHEQQDIADTFARLGLIPHTVDVKVAVWTPGVRATAQAGTQR
ncbi:MAG: sulfonate ABC transporter substrate-binding protein [Vulcanimicrobiaceae bacterium]|jgi:aliphatic sulfonates family ABC transporter substrate-binding protein